MVKGRDQLVSVRSNPDDVTVTVKDRDGRTVNTLRTPCSLSLKRGSGYFAGGRYTFVFEKPGYKPTEQRVDSHVGRWYSLGNLVWGGAGVIFGHLIIDPLTGAMWNLEPEQVYASLAPTDSAVADAPPSPSPTLPVPAAPALTAAPPAETEKPLKPAGTRWAVVVGVSSYKDTRIESLRYTARDAEGLYRWMVRPDGGGFAPSRVKKLLDKEATYENLRAALFEWARQAIEEDLLLIYLAGHGSPEAPDKLENLFFLPYDVDYDRIASKGFPMWDIETALKRFIKARRVVIIADACHSGGVGQGFATATRGVGGTVTEKLTGGLQSLSRIGDGVAVLTASGAKQLSRESEKWGDGHGVFTFFLLKGLEGDADYNKDGKVTLGELVPYVSESVRRETSNEQCPEVAGKFDPAMAIGSERR